MKIGEKSNWEDPLMFPEWVGQRIRLVQVHEEEARIFLKERVVVVEDDGQDCCEHRFMSCDDTLSEFLGATLLDITVEDVGTGEGEDYEHHEIQFVHIKTSLGVITLQSHNIHNGYYGGFDMRVTVEPLPKALPISYHSKGNGG